MAVVASELIQCEKYSVTHTMTFEETKPLFGMSKKCSSSPFFTEKDPNDVKFHIQFGFYQASPSRAHLAYPFVKCGIRATGRTGCNDMFLECKMSVVDANPKPATWTCHGGRAYFPTTISHNDTLKFEDFKFWDGFYLSVPTAPEMLSIKFEAVYYRVPVKGLQPKTAAIPNIDPNLQDDLLRFFVDAECADAKVTISVGERKFSAHKDWLRARSEYFKTMFGSGMEESRSNQLRIQDADPELFEELLKFLHLGLTPKNLRDIAQGLLPLADRFGVTTLKSMCAASIANNLDSKNVIKALLLADAHNSPDLAEKCVPIIRRNVKALKATEDWEELKKNPDALAPVLESLTV